VQLRLRRGGEIFDLRLQRDADQMVLERDGVDPIDFRVLELLPETLVLEIGGRRHRVRYWRRGTDLHLELRGRYLRVTLEDPDEAPLEGAGPDGPILRAPMPGKILDVLSQVGDRVEAGQALLRMEAMKMEIDVVAPMSGSVASLTVSVGDLVEPDFELLVIDPDPE
jgi:propionyl-CoA carboxylase alpha chain